MVGILVLGQVTLVIIYEQDTKICNTHISVHTWRELFLNEFSNSKYTDYKIKKLNKIKTMVKFSPNT